MLELFQSTLFITLNGVGYFILSTFVLFLIFKLKNPFLRRIWTNGIKGNRGNKMRLDTALRFFYSLVIFLFASYILVTLILPLYLLGDYFYYYFTGVGVLSLIFVFIVVFFSGTPRDKHKVSKVKVKLM